MVERELSEQAIEAAERTPLHVIQATVALLDGAAEGDKGPADIIFSRLHYHTDIDNSYECLRLFAVAGWFEGGRFDFDRDQHSRRVLRLSEDGQKGREAAHDMLQAKTGRRLLT